MTKIWPIDYDRQSKLEGWSLFDSAGYLRIQRLDDPRNVECELEIERGSIKKLRSDHAALELVAERAVKERSLMHTLALFLDGQPRGVAVPKALCGKKGTR